MTQTQCGCERQNPPDTPSAAPRTVHAGEALGAGFTPDAVLVADKSRITEMKKLFR